jgi:hypothetical protein
MEHFADNRHLVDAQAIADITAYINQLQISSAPGWPTSCRVCR